MLWLKGCPRCGGDLYRDWNVAGSYRQCIQCGHRIYESGSREPGAGALRRAD